MEISDSTSGNPSFDCTIVAPALEQMHEHVTRNNRRVEITRRGSDQRCVLISKQELAALEQALEILSDTDGFRHLSIKISELAAATGRFGYAPVM